MTDTATHTPPARRTGLSWPRWPAGVFAAALVGSLVLYRGLWTGAGDRVPALTGRIGDQLQSMWFLKWIAWAIVHGHNPFVSHVAGYPTGVNLAWNTSTPTLALLTAPITLTAGAATSYALLMTLAPALTTTTAFLWLRRHVDAPWAAIPGALLVGFGPFEIGHAHGHLHLAFAALIPLMLLLFEDLLWRRGRPQSRTALYLGLVTAAQLGISEELAVITSLGVLIALLAVLVVSPRAVLDAAPSSLRPFCMAVAIAVGLAAPLLIAQLGSGGLVPLDNNFWRANTNDYVYSAGNQVVPIWRLAHHHIGRAESTMFAGYFTIAVLAVGVVIRWRDRLVRIAAITIAVLVLMTYGDIKVGGIPLPWWFLGQAPGLQAILPIRFSFATWLAVAWLFSRWIDQAGRSAGGTGPMRRPTAVVGLVAITAALVTLVPARVATKPVPDLPSYFAAHNLPTGSLVLLLPISTPRDNTAMFVQQAADFRFVMPGGYFYRHNGSLWPEQTPLTRIAEQGTDPSGAVLALARIELASTSYRAIVVLENQPTSAALVQIAIALTGRGADYIGDGVEVWLLRA